MRKREITQKITSSALALSIVLTPISAFSQTPLVAEDDSVLIKSGISLGIIKGNSNISNLSLRDAEIRDVLYTLAQMGEFNLIVNDNIEGTLTVDLKNVSIEKTFEYILTLSDLTYVKDGNTFIVTTREDGNEKTLNRGMLKSLPVRFSNAQEIANVLNQTVFTVNRPGGNQQAVATADMRTNSLLVLGNERDIDLAKRAISELDFPLEHKTFMLKNAPATDVATAIAQTLFGVSLQANNAGFGGQQGGVAGQQGVQQGVAGQANVAGGAGVGGAQAGNLGIGPNVAGGAVAAPGGGVGVGGAQAGGAVGAQAGAVGGAGGVGGVGGAGGVGAAGDPLTTGQGVQVFQGGPMTFIVNLGNNTMTLIGTNEQIGLAESLIYDLDIRPPQVAIEVALISLTENKSKRANLAINDENRMRLVADNLGLTNAAGFTSIFFNRNGAPSFRSFVDQIQLNTLFSMTDAKTLAHPKIVAVSGTSSNINLTRQVFTGVRTTTNNNGGVSTSEPTTADVGITLNITPRVSNNGTINLNIVPTVSEPGATQTFTDANGQENTFTLINSSTLSIGNARIKDGETLILGGLVREGQTSGYGNKVPFLGDIPFLGNLFRNNQSNIQNRDELIVLVTPHIIKEEGVPYFREEWKQRAAYPDISYRESIQSGIQPSVGNPPILYGGSSKMNGLSPLPRF